MIPDFQTVMRPILDEVASGPAMPIRVLIEALSTRYALTPVERQERLASGQPVIYNRVHWAVTHLVKAGLLDRPVRGFVAITAAGAKERGAATVINMARLKALSPEYCAFLKPPVGPIPPAPADDPKTLSPQEAMSAAYLEHGQLLAAELLDQLKSSTPGFFEKVVLDLLLAMGYGKFRLDAGQHLGGSGDTGVDGVIREDKLGLDVIYVQAKRWDGVVGRETVQAFAGSLEGHRARRGVILTTSHFSTGAHQYVASIEKRIALIDGPRLADLMIEHGVGVEDESTYVVKKIDHDYFELG